MKGDAVAKPKRAVAMCVADIIAARRSLLQLWLGRLRDAERRHREELDRMADKKSIPDLRMPYPHRDMFDLLTRGIEAALAGSDDPFGIRPRRGVKLLRGYTKADRIEMIQEVAKRARELGKPTAAIEEIARERGLSFGTLRKFYYDTLLSKTAETWRTAP